MTGLSFAFGQLLPPSGSLRFGPPPAIELARGQPIPTVAATAANKMIALSTGLHPLRKRKSNENCGQLDDYLMKKRDSNSKYDSFD